MGCSNNKCLTECMYITLPYLFSVAIKRRCHIYYNSLNTINIFCSFKSLYPTFISKGVKLIFTPILSFVLGIKLDL